LESSETIPAARHRHIYGPDGIPIDSAIAASEKAFSALRYAHNLLWDNPEELANLPDHYIVPLYFAVAKLRIIQALTASVGIMKQHDTRNNEPLYDEMDEDAKATVIEATLS
jgi:hypothetical protein